MAYWLRAMIASAVIALQLSLSTATSPSECIPYSQRNPIASQYPANITGTVNATLVLLPIPFAVARSIIPAKYAILKDAYRSLLPNFREDQYPAMLQMIRDHDIRYQGINALEDFSRASIDFPFVDLLGDGHTPFRYVPTMLITSTAQIAIEASAAYGTETYPSSFSPDCNAYDFLSGPRSSEVTTYANATSVAGDGAAASISATFTRGGRETPPLPRAFFRVATNQPSFADGANCDSMTRFFDTPLSADAVPVAASVRANLDSVFGAASGRGDAGGMVWTDVPGWQVDSAFLEQHLISCQGLQTAAEGQASGQALGRESRGGRGAGGSEESGGSTALAALRLAGASPEALLEGGRGVGGEGEEGKGGAWFQELRGIWRGALKQALRREL